MFICFVKEKESFAEYEFNNGRVHIVALLIQLKLREYGEQIPAAT